MKKLISIILAVVMALPVGAISCFADKPSGGTYQLEKKPDGATYINIYTSDSKKQDSGNGSISTNLLYLLLCAGAVGFAAHKFGGPVYEFSKKTYDAGKTAWDSFGNTSKNVIIVSDKVLAGTTHPLSYISAVFSNKTQEFFDEHGVPKPENMTNAGSIATVAVGSGLTGAGAMGVYKFRGPIIAGATAGATAVNAIATGTTAAGRRGINALSTQIQSVATTVGALALSAVTNIVAPAAAVILAQIKKPFTFNIDLSNIQF